MRYTLSPVPLAGAPRPPVVASKINADDATINNEVLTSGTSLFLCAVVAFLSASAGVVVYRSREAEETTVPLSLYPTIVNLALLGNSLIAELFLVYTMDSAKAYSDLACVVIFGRLAHLAFSARFMVRILGPEKWVDVSQYNSLLNVPNFKHHIRLYGLVLLLALLETPALRLLPWRLSTFSAQHDGWPAPVLMRAALVVKLVQSSLTLCTTFAFIAIVTILTIVITNSCSSSKRNNKWNGSFWCGK
jgi:hypothetical protein